MSKQAEETFETVDAEATAEISGGYRRWFGYGGPRFMMYGPGYFSYGYPPPYRLYSGFGYGPPRRHYRRGWW